MRGTLLIAAPLVLLATVGVFASLRGDRPTADTPLPPPAAAAAATAPATPAPQPPGPAPAGKVWSAEHGHWHDAKGPIEVSTDAGNIAVEGMNLRIDARQMEGLVAPGSGAAPKAVAPPGKVWSAEHNHWHDAPAGVPANPAPPEEGLVWSAEHKHWHRADGTAAPNQPAPPKR